MGAKYVPLFPSDNHRSSSKAIDISNFSPREGSVDRKIYMDALTRHEEATKAVQEHDHKVDDLKKNLAILKNQLRIAKIEHEKTKQYEKKTKEDLKRAKQNLVGAKNQIFNAKEKIFK